MKWRKSGRKTEMKIPFRSIKYFFDVELKMEIMMIKYDADEIIMIMITLFQKEKNMERNRDGSDKLFLG